MLTLVDPAERKFYETLVLKEQLSVRKLVSAIDNQHYNKAAKQHRAAKGPRLKRPEQANYLYRAYAFDVIDADTLRFDIDLGFETFRRQRLRLVGIDAPERKSNAGKKARAFVRDRLAVADSNRHPNSTGRHPRALHCPRLFCG